MENSEKGIMPIFIVISCSILLFFYKVQEILPPFVGAFILSYILSKPTAYIEQKIKSRTLATTLILIPFIVLIVLLIGQIIPALQKQLVHLGVQGPLYIDRLENMINSAIETIRTNMPWLKLPTFATPLFHFTSFENFIYPLRNISLELFAQGFELIQRMTMILLMPIITFYWLKEWPTFVHTINLLVPPKHIQSWLSLGVEINRSLINFIVAQGKVCCILAVLYGIGLTIIGLNHSLLLAIGIGFAAFIPFGGVMAGLLVSIFVALFQYDSWINIVNVLIVFGVIQFIDASFISPRIVGSKIGVNPAWIMFALFAGGNLFGFWGIMLAAPTAAALSVIMKFAVQKYRLSPWYLKH